MFSFDLSTFISASTSGVPILFVVLALVFAGKRLGVAGRGLTALALVLGLGLGVGYQLAVVGVPAEFAGWFAVGVFGLGLGGLASLTYDLAKNVVENSIAKILGLKSADIGDQGSGPAG